MSQITITVGKKRNCTFIPIDQNGNPNPVGPDGKPLWPVGVPTWVLADLERSTGGLPKTTPPTGFTLTPSADGSNCDVLADVAGITLALHCYADRGDGVMIQGGSIIESIATTGPAPVIASLTLQFGPEA